MPGLEPQTDFALETLPGRMIAGEPESRLDAVHRSSSKASDGRSLYTVEASFGTVFEGVRADVLLPEGDERLPVIQSAVGAFAARVAEILGQEPGPKKH